MNWINQLNLLFYTKYVLLPPSSVCIMYDLTFMYWEGRIFTLSMAVCLILVAFAFHGVVLDKGLTFWMLYDEHVWCSVWVARRPPGYAFLEFDDRRDALDAIHALDGQYMFLSSWLLVKFICIPFFVVFF